MFSEKLNVYDDTNPDYIEMEDAAKAFVGTLASIVNAVPLYKYFPSKIYHNFLSSMDRLQTIGRKVIAKKYTGLKAAMETGTVDESKANGYTTLLKLFRSRKKYLDSVSYMVMCVCDIMRIIAVCV